MSRNATGSMPAGLAKMAGLAACLCIGIPALAQTAQPQVFGEAMDLCVNAPVLEVANVGERSTWTTIEATEEALVPFGWHHGIFAEFTSNKPSGTPAEAVAAAIAIQEAAVDTLGYFSTLIERGRADLLDAGGGWTVMVTAHSDERSHSVRCIMTHPAPDEATLAELREITAVFPPAIRPYAQVSGLGFGEQNDSRNLTRTIRLFEPNTLALPDAAPIYLDLSFARFSYN